MFVRVGIRHRRLEFLIPPFRDIVEHTFTGSYLLKPYGAHYRKSLRICSKKNKRSVGTVIVGNTSRRVSEWCNPSKAPPA